MGHQPGIVEHDDFMRYLGCKKTEGMEFSAGLLGVREAGNQVLEMQRLPQRP